MARYPFEEYTRVAWVTTIADTAAPTVAELTAGTDLTCFITKDGLNPGGTSNTVDSAGLCSRVDSKTIGSVSYDFTLRMFRDSVDADDDAWTLAAWGTSGYLVVRRGVDYDTAFAASQKVEVYTAQMGEPVMAGSAANASQTFELPLAVSAANLKATVAA